MVVGKSPVIGADTPLEVSEAVNVSDANAEWTSEKTGVPGFQTVLMPLL